MTTNGEGSSGTVLMVANTRPDIGFAWWLMEEFWIEIATLARGHNLRPVIAYPVHGKVPQGIVEAGITCAFVSVGNPGLRDLWRTCAFIVRHRVRVMYFTDRAFTALRYLVYRLLGVRVIINHDHTPGDRPPIRGILGFVKAGWRRVPGLNCNAQFCVAPLIRERSILNARIPAERLAVIQNGITPITCSGDRTYASRQLGLPADARVCISVGRAHPYKRIDFVIEVAKRCIVELGVQDLVFVYCGDGPDIERLRGLVRAYHLEHRFFFAGKRNDVPQLLCSSDYALHAAQGEAFSLAVIEYMSAGLAVLVPDIPSVRQAITDGETGLVYPDGDTVGAADRLLALHRDADLCRRIGAAASTAVRTHFRADHMHEMLRASVGELLRRWEPRTPA